LINKLRTRRTRYPRYATVAAVAGALGCRLALVPAHGQERAQARRWDGAEGAAVKPADALLAALVFAAVLAVLVFVVLRLLWPLIFLM
jgi:hypothetical protein